MFGKLPAKKDPRTLRLSDYMKEAAPPVSADYSDAVKKIRWPMFANDRKPCCTCSAAGHMIQLWTANAGKERIISDRTVVTVHNRFAKDIHKPHAHMLDILNHWRKAGIGGDRIMAYVILAPKNRNEVKNTIDLFGACYIGLALPDFVAESGTIRGFLAVDWKVSPKGRVGNAAPKVENGHTVAAVKYDPHNLSVVTWGKLKSMSWEFYEAYMEEAYAVLSPEFIDRRGTHAAFSVEALKNDVKKLSEG